MATNDQTAPRAVIHQRILDSAAAQPNASMEELASEVAGASTELVERVLEEYGDPGHQETPAAPTPEEEPMIEHATPPSAVELTDKERRTLRAIAEHPSATQSEIAERLDVTRATVNKRVNAIDGFEWKHRREFVADVFGDDALGTPAGDEPTADDPDPEAVTPSAEAASDGGQWLSSDVERAIEQLQERVAQLEQLAESHDGAGPSIEDTELVAKLVRAVMADEAISNEEELRIINAVL